MIKKIIYFICLVLFFLISKAQESEAFKRIAKAGRSYKDFIPKGCDTLGMAKGDLNKDGREDIVLALNNISEGRIILVLFKTGSGYSLHSKATGVLMCKECGGNFDPYAGVIIRNGLLIINHFGGTALKWEIKSIYTYQNNEFYLIGERQSGFRSNGSYCDKYDEFSEFSFQETNYITGQQKLKEISGDCKLIVNKKTKVKIKPLVRMADYVQNN